MPPKSPRSRMMWLERVRDVCCHLDEGMNNWQKTCRLISTIVCRAVRLRIRLFPNVLTISIPVFHYNWNKLNIPVVLVVCNRSKVSREPSRRLLNYYRGRTLFPPQLWAPQWQLCMAPPFHTGMQDCSQTGEVVYWRDKTSQKGKKTSERVPRRLPVFIWEDSDSLQSLFWRRN